MKDSRQKTLSPWDSAVSTRKTPKRRGGRSNTMDALDGKTPVVDVTIIFAEDTSGWDTYLTDFLNFFQESPGPRCTQRPPLTRLKILHKKLEQVNFGNISPAESSALSTSRATLIILSPAFINYIETHADVYELCKILKPTNTIAMLCAVTDNDIGPVHRAALVSYDAWPKLIAKNTDNEFVLSLVHALQEVLAKSHESTRLVNKYNLKLTPRKVKEGHNKVFLLMEQPLDPILKVQVFLESEGCREVPVKQRNPYTLQFIVPETYLKVSKILNVHIRCQGKLLGVLPLKVESLMGELSAILSAVDSPYELLCRTLGLDSRHQVDSFLTERFRQRQPKGFLTEWVTSEASGPMTKTDSIKEELPTLLHFSACYGLKLFTRLLLECPAGTLACSIKNTRGLTPSQLANYAGHNDLASLLNEVENGSSSSNTHSPRPKPKPISYENLVAPTTCWSNLTYVNMPFENENSGGSYNASSEHNSTKEEQFSPTEAQADIPPPWEESAKENYYISMHAAKAPELTELKPHEIMLLQEFEAKNHHKFCVEEEISIQVQQTVASEATCIANNCFTDSQNELANILESFKKGRNIEEIEKDVHEWKRKNSVPLQEDEENLNQLRLEYEKKLSESSPSTRKKGFLESLIPLLRCEKKKMGMVNSQSNTSLSSMENMEGAATASPSNIKKKALPITPPLKNTLNVEDIDPSRPNSTISSSGSSHSRSSTASNFSNLSVNSVYDSGNQTDSCEENFSKGKGYVNQSVITQALKKLPVSVPRQRIFPLKPPAPPPRIRRSPINDEEEEHYSQPRHNVDLCHQFAGKCTTQNTCDVERPGDRLSQQEYVGPDYAAACYHYFRQNRSAPNLTNATSSQSLNARGSSTSCEDEECYWIPPPPIPVYRKASASSLNISGPCSPDSEYDIPKPTVIFSPISKGPSNNNQLPDNECHYYAIPRSVQKVSKSSDSIPNEAPPPPPGS